MPRLHALYYARHKDEAEDRIWPTVAPLPGVEKPVRHLRKFPCPSPLVREIETTIGKRAVHKCDPFFGPSIPNRALLWVTHSLRIRIWALPAEVVNERRGSKNDQGNPHPPSSSSPRRGASTDVPVGLAKELVVERGLVLENAIPGVLAASEQESMVGELIAPPYASFVIVWFRVPGRRALKASVDLVAD